MTDFATLMRAQVEISATGQSTVGIALKQTIDSVRDVKAELSSFGTDFKQLFLDTRTNAERYKATVDTLVDTLKNAREEADRLADSQRRADAHSVISNVESRILPKVERDFDLDGSYARKNQLMEEGARLSAQLASETEKLATYEARLNEMVSIGAISQEKATAALNRYAASMPSANAAREKQNQLQFVANEAMRNAMSPAEKLDQQLIKLKEAYEAGAFAIKNGKTELENYNRAVDHTKNVYTDATVANRRFTNAIQQGSYGVQDFVQVLGDAGLGRALMASANNFSQVAAVAIPGFGAALAGVVITAGAAFLNFMSDAKKKTLEFNQALKETNNFFKELEAKKDVSDKVREASQQTPDEVKKRIARLKGNDDLGPGAIADAQAQEAAIQKNRNVRMANQFNEVINILGAVKTPIRGFLEGKTTVGAEDARANIGRQLFWNAEPGAAGKLNAAVALPGNKTVQDSFSAMLKRASAMAGEEVSFVDMNKMLDPLHARFDKRAIHLFSRMSQNALNSGQFRELETAIKAVDKDAGEKFSSGLAKFREESENAQRATRKLAEELRDLEKTALPAAEKAEKKKKLEKQLADAEDEDHNRQLKQFWAGEKEREKRQKQEEKFAVDREKLMSKLGVEEASGENPMRAKLADIARDFEQNMKFINDAWMNNMIGPNDELDKAVSDSALSRVRGSLRNERKRLRDLEDRPDAKFTDIQGLGKSIQESLTVTKEERDRKEQIELAKKNIAVGEKIEKAVKEGNGGAAVFAARGGGG